MEIDKSEQYVTLSYTWGDSGVIKTTDTTISSFRAGVPLSTLPETLRDVINVTRSIGVKYIWIDSLCIIQDQELENTDFSREAPHMGEIYTNSLLTIAASRFKGTHSSCFSTRISSMLKPPRFNAPADFISQRYGSNYFYVIDEGCWKSAVSDAPLNSRGWVLQERLLSPRTVHFCKEQTFWECSGLEACESLPTGFPEFFIISELPAVTNQLPRFQQTLSTAQNKPQLPLQVGIAKRPEKNFRSFKNTMNFQNDPPETGSPGKLIDSQLKSTSYERWLLIIEAYTRCDLTNPTDRVVAIAGVAARLKGVLNDTFVAGLWKERIMYGLAWRIANRVKGKRPLSRDGREVYCGPSWSWVSVVGGITHDKSRVRWEDWTQCAVVESCVVQPSNEEFHQPVSRGTALRLRGRLQPLYYRAKPVDTGRWRDPVLSSSHFACGYVKIRHGIRLDSTTTDDHWNDQLAVVPFLRANDLVFALILRKGKDGYQRIGLYYSSGGTSENREAILDVLFHSAVVESSFQIV